jgi:hypothetical protein
MANARDVHVDVILESDNPVKFSVEPSPPGSLPMGPNGELIFANDHHPGFHIHFHLQDPHCLGYRFPKNSDKKEAIWSQLGSGACPSVGKWEVFQPLTVGASRMILTVDNPNPKPAQGPFGYTLRVTKDNGATYLALDPGGVNQNGSQSMNLSLAAALLGGAAAGSLLTLGAQALLQS